MRRMYSEKGIYDTVNKGIEEGEIEVGGLPEIEAGDAGKVLKVNEQEDGVEWGEAGGSEANILTIEAVFSSWSATSAEVVLTPDIVEKLFNNYYTLVVLQASTSGRPMESACALLYNTSAETTYRYQGVSLSKGGTTVNPRVPGISSSNSCTTYIVTPKAGTTDTLTINRSSSGVVQAEDVWGIYINLAGGTLSATEFARLNNNKFQTPVLLNGVTGTTYVKLYNCFYSNSTAVYRSIPCTGISAQYEATIDLSTKAYTVITI